MLTLRPRTVRWSFPPPLLRLGPPPMRGVWRPVRAAAARRPPAAVAIPAVVGALLALLPVAYLLLRATEGGSDAWQALLRPRTATIAVNTGVLAVAVSLSTTLIGVPLAWLTTRTDLPGRSAWATMAVLPLVIPSYVGALALVAALGPKGIVQGWLAPFGVDRLPSIYGFWGSWLALTLFTYPYVFLTVRAALRGLDPALEDASRCLGFGPWRTFFATTLPQLRPAIAAGALLAALYTVAEFGVVTLLRYDAFTRAIYVQYRSALDRSSAATLALLLILFTAALLVVEARLRGRLPLHRSGIGATRRARPVPLGAWRTPAVLFCGAVVGLAIGVPLAVLGGWLARALAQGAIADGLWTAARHSLLLGLGAALATTLAAIPLAVLIARYPGRLAALVERAAYFGYALPGLVVALAFVAFGVLTPFHQTVPLLILAYGVRFLPEATAAVRLSLLQISPRLEDAARSLGRTPAGVVRAVLVPLARPGVVAGAALVFLTTMKELPVTLLLSPTGYPTLATEIWQAANDAAFGQAAAPALLLVGASAIPTLFLAARDRASAA